MITFFIDNTKKTTQMQPYQIQQAYKNANQMKQQFTNFNHKLFITLRKKSKLTNQNIKRSHHDLANQLIKIQYQSNRLKSFLIQTQAQFKNNVQQVANKDKVIWTDSSKYFCNKFLQLEEMSKKQQRYNQECKIKIEDKKKEVQNIWKQIYRKNPDFLQRYSNTKIDFEAKSRSKSMLSMMIKNDTQNHSFTVRKRNKTQLSIHHQPSNKQIQTQKQQTSLSAKKTIRYLQPIKKIKMKQNSLLPLLKSFLIQCKPCIQTNQRNWFNQLIFSDRSLKKLITYLDFHSKERNIKKILPN